MNFILINRQKLKSFHIFEATVLVFLFSFTASAIQNRVTTIKTFDFKETPLCDVLKVFTVQTGKNVVAAPDIKDLKITLYLERVGVGTALKTLCKNYGLWYKEENSVIRIMKINDFSGSLAFEREENIRYLTLKYASCISIAEIVSSIYEDRIQYKPPSSVESFNHVGTDVFPSIGRKLRIDEESRNRYDNKTDKTNKDKIDLGGVSATNEDIKRIINAVGSVTPDSLLSKRIGQPVASMTVFLRDNSVIIRSVDTKLINDISDLIYKLDTPTRQVLLEMKILEITLGDGFKSFVDLSITPGANLAGDGTKIRSTDRITGIDFVNQGALTNSSFKMAYVSDLLNARMELYEKENRVKKIGSPVMLCANNASGRFFQGVNSFIRKGYSVLTTKNNEGDITDEYVKVELEEVDVGVKLEISPSINQDNTVALKIVAEISNLVLGGGPEIPYVIKGTTTMGQTDAIRKTTIQDIVVGVDGQSLALGGLIEETDVNNEKMVPFLGKIPILGFFFRSKEKSKERKELIFMICPHIISSPVDGDSINNRFFKGHSQHPYYSDSLDKKNENIPESADLDSGSTKNRLFKTRKKPDISTEIPEQESTDWITDDFSEVKGNMDMEKEYNCRETDSSENESYSNTITEKNNSHIFQEVNVDSSVLSQYENITVNNGDSINTGTKDTVNMRKKEKIYDFLNKWRNAWSQRDIEHYMSFYDESFFGKGMTRRQWMNAKSAIFSKANEISLTIRNMKIGWTQDDMTEIEFEQHYKSDYYCDISEKIMLLIKQQNSFLIAQEDIKQGKETPYPCSEANVTDDMTREGIHDIHR